MPYYVYAIHTDSKLNRLCGSFADYQKAEFCEQDKRKGGGAEGNFFVAMVYAEDRIGALQRVKQIRSEKGLPSKQG